VSEGVVAQVCELFARSQKILCFTGAGVSTNSKIPDFRGPAGLYQTRSPTYFSEFVASEEARVQYWSFKRDSFPVFRDARPNATHLAIVELDRLGRLEAVVTQNVDGLHRAAGSTSERLIELHGTGAEGECLGCLRREPLGACLERFDASGEPPRCTSCSELMKPAVVMFGQSLEPETLRRANAAAERADLVLSLGSSLTVTPAANVPLLAVRRRVPYVIVNRGATPHDEVATVKIDMDVDAVIPRAVEKLSAVGY
jgi:NAD-dependent deacetylase